MQPAYQIHVAIQINLRKPIVKYKKQTIAFHIYFKNLLLSQILRKNTN
jgi:hypothetical protein